MWRCIQIWMLIFFALALSNLVSGFGFSSMLAKPSCRLDLSMRERKCDITGQRKNSKCMSVSNSNHRIHKVQGVNLQWRKIWWPEGNSFVRMRLATRTLRTITKYGLHKTALKYGCKLEDYIIPGAIPRPIYKPPVKDSLSE